MAVLFKLLALLLVIKAARARRAGAASGGASMTASAQTSTAGSRPAEESPIPPQRGDQPGPDSPLELEAPDWKVTLKRTLKEIKDDRVTLVAAGMAYYFFLAIFPAFIALVGVMGLVEADTGPLIESIRSSLPGDSGLALTEPLSAAGRAGQTSSLVAAITGIAIALWSASSGMVALQSGLNVAYDVRYDRKFVGKRVVALMLLIAAALLGGVPSPFFTFGESWFFTALGWMLTVVAVVLLFSVFYYLGPNRPRPDWRWVSAGGVVGALLWILTAVGFSVYVGSLGGENSYTETYGSAAGVIVLILLLFLSSLAVLIGGELNAETERQAERRSN